MNSEGSWPKTGIGVMVLRDGKVLLGRRKGSHGAGEYGFPGGHLEYLESFEECARRETREEAGVEIKNIRFSYVADIRRYAPKHYTHIGLIADWAAGDPVIKEPDKCGGWNWFDPRNLPKDLFGVVALAFDSFRTGKNYYDGEEADRLMEC